MNLNLPEIPDKLRGPLKYAGYVLFAVLAFLISVYLTFPYEKVKDRLETEASSSGDYEFTIGSLGPSPLFGVAASDVIMQQKAPPGGGDKKAGLRVVIERASVGFSPFGLLFGHKRYDFSIKALGGRISGSYEDDKGNTAVKIKVSAVELAKLPGFKELVPLPMTGTISGSLAIAMPKGRLAQSEGELELRCNGCTIGDGKARLKIPAATAMFAEGVLVDKVALGKFGGRVVIEKGTARFEGFQAKSVDLELTLEGEVGLTDPVGNSSFRTGYVTFKPSDSGKKKQPFTMMDLALSQTAKRPDGFFGWRVSGPLRSPTFTASKFSPMPARGAGRPSGARPKRFEAGAGRPQLGAGRFKPTMGGGGSPGGRPPGMPRGPGAAPFPPPRTPIPPVPQPSAAPPPAPVPLPPPPPLPTPAQPPPPEEPGAPGTGDHPDSPPSEGQPGAPGQPEQPGQPE